MDNLNYNHLRYFWAVARHGNLTRACNELHITPQTVSSQLRLLEDSLGAALFDMAKSNFHVVQSCLTRSLR